MKINIIVPSTSSINIINNGANVQGDEMMARSWAIALMKDSRVALVAINNIENEYDVSISFNPTIESQRPAKYKVLYLQNTFPEDKFKGGVKAVFNAIKGRYNAFIFASQALMEACGEGLVCPFAVDTDLFYPRPSEERFAHNLCFVGNNLRGDEINRKYMFCVGDKGLVIYGNPYGWNSPYCAGKLSWADEPILYSSAKICLNSHMKEHLEMGVFNYRLFTILACRGFIISDKSEWLEKEFKDAMVFTDGNDNLRELVDFYLQNPKETDRFRDFGYNYILNKHTFKHRIKYVLDWLVPKL